MKKNYKIIILINYTIIFILYYYVYVKLGEKKKQCTILSHRAISILFVLFNLFSKIKQNFVKISDIFCYLLRMDVFVLSEERILFSCYEDCGTHNTFAVKQKKTLFISYYAKRTLISHVEQKIFCIARAASTHTFK